MSFYFMPKIASIFSAKNHRSHLPSNLPLKYPLQALQVDFYLNPYLNSLFTSTKLVFQFIESVHLTELLG